MSLRRFPTAVAIFLVLVSYAWVSVHAQNKPDAKSQTHARAAAKPQPATAPASLTDRQRAIHALNRLTFGPTPGEVDAVLTKDLDSWIEDQLHPESIDDSALNARLAPFATTHMNPKQLATNFPSDAVIRQVMMGKRTIPDDPLLKLVYSVNVARLQQQDAAKSAPDANASQPAPDGGPPKLSPEEQQARTIADSLLALPKGQRLAAIENTPPDQLVNFPNLLRGDQRDRLVADFTPQEREVFRALASPQAVVVSELQQAKLIRAVYSERQLQEVLTDFWLNHFNVFQGKNQDAYYTTAYERDVIRPHVLGKFYDLLVATAESPAMLMYLDNWLSIGPHSDAAGKGGQNGLNENYGREVMELHTVGVDGGYTQDDVTQLAAVLTGWTIAQPDDGGQFQFDPHRHEPGMKAVLGEKFYDTGMEEGLRALSFLAHQPATAHFISRCIATRFVSDDPPASLVARMAATFTSTDGDIREVMRTMLRSPEFWSPDAYRAKLKSPLEFVVSAIRASGANVAAPDALTQTVTTMGMQPYGMVPPTGYPMKSASWENTGAVLARINFATSLTQNKVAGAQFEPGNLLALGILASSNLSQVKSLADRNQDGLDFAVNFTVQTIFQGDSSEQATTAIRKQVQEGNLGQGTAGQAVDMLRYVAGFSLASPDFQRH